MHTPSTSLLSLAALLCLQGATANPVPEVPGHGMCNTKPQYTIDSQTKVAGQPVNMEGSCAGSGSGCQGTTGTTFSTGVTTEVGASLDLDLGEIVSAGVSTSVATTTEKGTETSFQKACPSGSWTCTLIITPEVIRVTGKQTPINPSGCMPDDSKSQPYTVDLPSLDDNGQVQPGHVDICACKNYPGWADPGAPSIVCPQDCTL